MFDKDNDLVDLLQYGFPINYSRSKLPCVPFTNHHSARAHPHAVDKYITKELSAGGLIGPFDSNPLTSPVILSPLQSVEKKVADDPLARRIVVDLSYPDGTSVYDGIPKDLYLGQDYQLRYPSVDNLIKQIQTHGPGCLIFKVDLARAFRQLLFMCPGDIGKCAFGWRGHIYLDIAFPFGLRSACLNCQRVADAICRIYERMYNRPLIGYVDDFAAAQPRDKADAAYSDLINLLCNTLGVELSIDKCAPPASSQIFLGLEADTVDMSISVPTDKLNKAACMIKEWLKRSSATKRQLQSLLGTLIHISAAVLPGRRFVARIIELIKKEERQIVLDRPFKLDLLWWDTFMANYNGISLIQDPVFTDCDSVLSTDSCLSGMGAVTSKGFYCHTVYPPHIQSLSLSISALELLSIVVACRLWGSLWPRTKLVLRCDNEGVCYAVNSGRSRSPFMQAALRQLWLAEAFHNFTIRCIHIPGIDNTLPDLLSRWHLSSSNQHKFTDLTKSMTLTESIVMPNLFDMNWNI